MRCPPGVYSQQLTVRFTGSALSKDYSDNLAVSSFSPSALGNDPLAFLEAKSGRESSTDGGHCAFKADSSHAESESVKVRTDILDPDSMGQAFLTCIATRLPGNAFRMTPSSRRCLTRRTSNYSAR
jgi:hypothetical protein